MKLAIAMALLRSKLLHNTNPPPPHSDALRWKRKAKERKQELLRLKEDLREAEDGLRHDLFPPSASCKCHFFDDLGKLSPNQFERGSNRNFNDVLRRRFLRQVRLKERRRKRTDDSIKHNHYSDIVCEDETEQLRASIDFLVELCDTASPVENSNFTNWSHQAVDFILASLKNLLSVRKNVEYIEGIINSLIMHLVRRLCTPLKGDELHHLDADHQFYVQHLIRKLGSDPFVGHRAILSVSQRISLIAESLLFLDPFDDAFPNLHGCMFVLIQLIEFLISDYFLVWSRDEGFDNMLFVEWVTSILHARKALKLLESRNGLYVLYMDRVTGELTKHVGQVSLLQELNPDIINILFH